MNKSHQPTIGFVGLGSMGSHMVRRLLEAGHAVRVLDVRAEALDAAEALGGVRASTARELGDTCDVVCLSLPRPSDVEQVVLGPNGVIEGTRFGTVIDFSTSGPQMARRIAKALAEVGHQALDAPVSGGPRGAESGTLCIMVAGDYDTFQRYSDLLGILGRAVVHLGVAPGQGQMMKVINNTVSASCLTASCEGLALGAKVGLDPQAMIDVLNASTARNTHTEDKLPRCVLSGRFDFGFALALMLKDVRLCLAAAQDEAVTMMLATMTQQLLALQISLGGDQQDITEIMRLVEGWAGVTVRSRTQTDPGHAASAGSENSGQIGSS